MIELMADASGIGLSETRGDQHGVRMDSLKYVLIIILQKIYLTELA